MDIFRFAIILALGCFLAVDANRRALKPAATSVKLVSKSPRARGVAEKYSIKEQLFQPDSQFEYALFKEANFKDRVKKKIVTTIKEKQVRKEPKIITKPIPGQEFVSFSNLGSVNIPPVQFFNPSHFAKTSISERGPKVIEHPPLPSPTFGDVFSSVKNVSPLVREKEIGKGGARNLINLKSLEKDIPNHQYDDFKFVSVPPGIFSFKFIPSINPMRSEHIEKEIAEPSNIDTRNADFVNSQIEPLQTSETRTRSKIEIKEVNGTLYEYEYIYYYDEEPALYDYDVPIVDDPLPNASTTTTAPAIPSTTTTTTPAPIITTTAKIVPNILLSRGSRPSLKNNEILRLETVSEADNQVQQDRQQSSIQAGRGRLVPHRGGSRAINNEVQTRNSLLRPNNVVNKPSTPRETPQQTTETIKSPSARGRVRGRGRVRPPPNRKEEDILDIVQPSKDIVQTPVRPRGRISLSRGQPRSRLAPQPVQPPQRKPISKEIAIPEGVEIQTNSVIQDVKKDFINDAGKLPFHTRFPPRTTTPTSVKGVKLNIDNSKLLSNIEDDLAAFTAEAQNLPPDILEQELDALFAETTTRGLPIETESPAISAINLYALSRAIDAESETTTEVVTATEAQTKPPVDYGVFYDYAYDVADINENIPTSLPEIIQTTQAPEPTMMKTKTTPTTTTIGTTTKPSETTTKRQRGRGRGRSGGASRFRRPNNGRGRTRPQVTTIGTSTTEKVMIETSTKLNAKPQNKRNRANIIRGRTRPNLSRFGSRSHIRSKNKPEKEVKAVSVAEPKVNSTEAPIIIEQLSTTAQPKFRGRFSRPRPNIKAFRARSKKLQQQGAAEPQLTSRGNLFNKLPERKRQNRLNANKEAAKKMEKSDLKSEVLETVKISDMKNETSVPEVLIPDVTTSKPQTQRSLAGRRHRLNRPGLGRFSRNKQKTIEKQPTTAEEVKPDQLVASENNTTQIVEDETPTNLPVRPSRFGGRRGRTRSRHRFNTRLPKVEEKPEKIEEVNPLEETKTKTVTLTDIISPTIEKVTETIVTEPATEIKISSERSKGRRFLGRNRNTGGGRRQKLSEFLGKPPSQEPASTTKLPILKEDVPITESPIDIAVEVKPVEEPSPETVEVGKPIPEELLASITTEKLSRRELLALRRRQFLGRS